MALTVSVLIRGLTLLAAPAVSLLSESELRDQTQTDDLPQRRAEALVGS